MTGSIFNYERRDMTDLEKKWRREENTKWAFRLILISLFMILMAIFAARTLAPRHTVGATNERPVAMKDGQRVDLGELCTQYRADHKTSGDKMDPETAAICGF